MNELNPYNPPVVKSAVAVASNWPPPFVSPRSLPVSSSVSCDFPCLHWIYLGTAWATTQRLNQPSFQQVATSAAIVFFGFIGNGLLLGRIAWGIPFGVCYSSQLLHQSVSISGYTAFRAHYQPTAAP